ncbi:MAG: ferritin-like domain-containing protein [Ilumatobacteraceae bacterium]
MSIQELFPTADGERRPIGRRTLLGAGATLVGAALLAACGGDDDDATGDSTGATSGGLGAPDTSAATATMATTAGTMTTDAPGSTEAMTETTMAGGGDLAIAQLAAGLEVLAVSTYQSAADAAGSGALGAVPPAVGEYVATALAQHQAHLDAWNKVITDGGGDAVTEPNATLAPVVAADFAKVTDVAGAAMLALDLEDIAAQTYLSAIPVLESPEAIQLAGSIQIIDQQHQAILLFALGEYPVPEVFQKTDKAVAA